MFGATFVFGVMNKLWRPTPAGNFEGRHNVNLFFVCYIYICIYIYVHIYIYIGNMFECLALHLFLGIWANSDSRRQLEILRTGIIWFCSFCVIYIYIYIYIVYNIVMWIFNKVSASRTACVCCVRNNSGNAAMRSDSVFQMCITANPKGLHGSTWWLGRLTDRCYAFIYVHHQHHSESGGSPQLDRVAESVDRPPLCIYVCMYLCMRVCM